MIDLNAMVSMPFLKKSRFTGSYHEMNYLLWKQTEEEETFLEAVVWKGPYSFAVVSEEEKTKERFPFEEDGLKQAVAWLNQIYEERYEESGSGQSF